MSSDPSRLYRSLVSAEKSAFIALPATYRLADSFAFAGDERESSASLHFDQPVTETDILNLDETLRGPSERLKGQLVQIMMSDFNIKDQQQRQVLQQQKEAQIRAVIEQYTKQIEAMLKRIAEVKAENKHETAKTRQLRRMIATSIPSSQEDSDEKKRSMEEIENAYTVGPDDITVA